MVSLICTPPKATNNLSRNSDRWWTQRRGHPNENQPVAIVRRFDAQCGPVTIDGTGFAFPKVGPANRDHQSAWR
jgi:hypothetical protein